MRQLMLFMSNSPILGDPLFSLHFLNRINFSNAFFRAVQHKKEKNIEVATNICAWIVVCRMQNELQFLVFLCGFLGQREKKTSECRLLSALREIVRWANSTELSQRICVEFHLNYHSTNGMRLVYFVCACVAAELERTVTWRPEKMFSCK